MDRQLHTPEGVRDYNGIECERKDRIEDSLKKTIQSYGYDRIETPTFEFFDTFGSRIGTTPSRDLYKFFDREGNTLVLRPDVTPSVARSYANYYSKNQLLPVRLFYSGNVYINYSSLQGRLKETTQIGAECIGDNSISADAELVAVSINALRSSGLSDFTISIGHVNFLKALMDTSSFTEEEEEQAYDLIINKNIFGLEELLSNKDISPKLRKLYTSIGQLLHTPEDFIELRKLADGYPLIEETFSYFEKLYTLLEAYGVEKYISFELGLVSQYRYYTGLLFFGYTYGSGKPVLSGGRYDKLLSYFGCDRPAIGFAIFVDSLLMAIERQGIDMDIKKEQIACFYDEADQIEAISYANQQRNAGKSVTLYQRSSDSNLHDRIKKELTASGVKIWEKNT